jgi:hypothetical protein
MIYQCTSQVKHTYLQYSHNSVVWLIHVSSSCSLCIATGDKGIVNSDMLLLEMKIPRYYWQVVTSFLYHTQVANSIPCGCIPSTVNILGGEWTTNNQQIQQATLLWDIFVKCVEVEVEKYIGKLNVNIANQYKRIATSTDQWYIEYHRSRSVFSKWILQDPLISTFICWLTNHGNFRASGWLYLFTFLLTLGNVADLPLSNKLLWLEWMWLEPAAKCLTWFSSN